jgi:transcriptional regulator with XRE-family HTH domain
LLFFKKLWGISVLIDLAGRIRQRRKMLGLTQAQLAERVGVKPLAVTMWETGKTEAGHANLVTLADIFGVTVDWLLTGRHPQQAHTQQQAAPQLTDAKSSHLRRLNTKMRDLPDGDLDAVEGVIDRLLECRRGGGARPGQQSSAG